MQDSPVHLLFQSFVSMEFKGFIESNNSDSFDM